LSQTHFISEKFKSLKRGHLAILLTIDEIQAIAHSYLKAKPKIRTLQEQVFAYFSLQKDDLFEELTHSFKGNQEKLKLIEFLKHDLKEMKIKALYFVDEHPADMADIRPKKFSADFAQFAKDLHTRFKIEEEYLFPLEGSETSL